MIIKKEKQSRMTLHEGNVTMKPRRHLHLARIRTRARFAIFHLQSTGFYALIFVAWSQSKIANKLNFY